MFFTGCIGFGYFLGREWLTTGLRGEMLRLAAWEERLDERSMELDEWQARLCEDDEVSYLERIWRMESPS